MAERVQRFIYDNKILGSATVLSATSQQPGNPVSFILDPLRSKGWRSKVGWTIVAGFNNKLDFNEDANARVATITAGTYATGTTMATAIQAAMNAASGVANTYTVTYSAVFKKFTIERATGTAALTLKFEAGAPNWAASVHVDIGFADTDASGTPLEATFAAYQSRQAILVDLGSAQSIAAVSVIITAGSADVTDARVQGSGSTFVGVGAGATPTFEQTLFVAEPVRTAFFGSVSHRYWRFLINGVQSALGYVEVSVFGIGTYFQPSRSYVQGNTQQAEMLTDTLRGDQGAIYRNPKNTPKRHVVTFRNWPTADRDTYVAMEDASVGLHIFFITDALNSPGDTTLYGVIESSVDIGQSIGDGTPPDRFSFTLTFLEDLG